MGQRGPYALPALEVLLAAEEREVYDIRMVVEGLGHRPQHALGLASRAQARGLDAWATRDINAPATVLRLLAAQCDILVCVGFDRLLNKAVRQSFSLCLNAHPSALPRYRGPSPIFWALFHGETQSAVTVHEMDARADHGPLADSMPWALRPQAAGDVLFQDAGRLAGRLLARVLLSAYTGSLVMTPQSERGMSLAPRPQPADSLVLPGLWRADALVNFVSAAPYFQAAWVQHADGPWVIRGGRLSESTDRKGATPDRLTVACRDGWVTLLR